MVRVTSSTMVPGSDLYSYLDIDGLGTTATASSYSLAGGVTSAYYWDMNCTSYLKWWENGSATDITSNSGHYGGYKDMQLVASSPFTVTRTNVDRYITFECYSTCAGGSGSAQFTAEVPHLPAAPTSLTATRISDNRIDLSWTNPSSTYGGFYIQVSIDGGAWSTAWSVENVMPTSYSYTAASAGHSYKFRAYTGHWYAYSAYSNETATISMTPSAPQSISVAASGGTNVTVTLANDSAVATSLEYQTSTDGGSTWSASTTVSGSPVTSFSTSVSGTALIRVRNKNATGVSDWLVSDPITTICPPAPPTLRTPSGSVYDMAQGDIEFSWLHNSLDGSTQTAYQLRYAINGGAWTTLSGTTAQSRTVSLGNFSVGDSVTWQVRTKGADANYSDWSQTGAFSVYTAPTLSITSPGATITGMPIILAATYSDMAGFTCQAATASLQKDGRTLFSEPATISGSSITASLTTDEFLPTNGESYTVVLTARSSSGLSTSANATFTVDFVEPQAGELGIVNDPETGYASLLATFDNSASEITYTGSTNEQYDSTEGYVRSLTVDGKSEVQNGSLVSIEGVSVSGLNQTGFFQNSPTDTSYWFTTDNHEYITQLEDGWARFDENSKNINVSPKIGAWRPKLSTQYVVMCEVRNASVTGNVYFRAYTQASSVWTASSSVKITGDGVFTVSPTSKADFTGVTHDRIFLDASASGASFSGDVRISVYEYPYTGEYRKYVPIVTITATLRSLPDGTCDTMTYNSDGTATITRNVGYLDYSTDNEWTNATQTSSAGLNYIQTDIDVIAPLTYEQNTALCYSSIPMSNLNFANTTIESFGVNSIVNGTHRAYWRYNAQGQEATVTNGLARMQTLGAVLLYPLATPITETISGIGRIEIGSAFTVATDLDSTFEMTTWDGSADAVSISVSRVNPDGTITPLLTDGASGSGVVDKYAPLNTPYQYAVTTTAATQAVKTVYVDNELVTDLWFVYWGENIASAKWNPDNGGIQVTRPQKTRVYYAGRRDPVSYDGHAVSLTETPSWMFLGKDEVDTFVGLIEDGGRGVYKSCDGWVYHADFDLTLTPSYTAIGYYGGASLGITRIAGDRL